MHLLKELRLGVFGLGRIGSDFSRKMRPFVGEILGYDPLISTLQNKGILPSSADEIFSECEIISLHLPLSALNHHFIGDSAINKMTKKPMLINVSRGGLVNTDSLTRFVQLKIGWRRSIRQKCRLPSSFAGWFPTDPASGSSPPSWKQSMLVVLMLFPIVALEVRFLTPMLGGLNAAMATFICNVISVFLLAWPFMPIIVAAMNWWVFPREDNSRWIDRAGIALLIALYAIEIAVFSRLL